MFFESLSKNIQSKKDEDSTLDDRNGGSQTLTALSKEGEEKNEGNNHVEDDSTDIRRHKSLDVPTKNSVKNFRKSLSCINELLLGPQLVKAKVWKVNTLNY